MHRQSNIREKITQIYDKTKKSSKAGDYNGSWSCWGSLEKGEAEPECIWLTSALASYQCQCHELRKNLPPKVPKVFLFSLHTAGRFGIIPKKSGSKKLNETFMVLITSQKWIDHTPKSLPRHSNIIFKIKKKKAQILRWLESSLGKKLTDEDDLQQTASLTSAGWIKYVFL